MQARSGTWHCCDGKGRWQQPLMFSVEL